MNSAARNSYKVPTAGEAKYVKLVIALCTAFSEFLDASLSEGTPTTTIHQAWASGDDKRTNFSAAAPADREARLKQMLGEMKLTYEQFILLRRLWELPSAGPT